MNILKDKYFVGGIGFILLSLVLFYIQDQQYHVIDGVLVIIGVLLVGFGLMQNFGRL